MANARGVCQLVHDYYQNCPPIFGGMVGTCHSYYIWVKVNGRGQIIRGQGVPPTFAKPTTELILAATTTSTGSPFSLLDLGQGQVELHPRAEHSRKPSIFRQRIEELCGDRSLIELFARETRDGWDSWGIELDKFDEPVQERLIID